MHLETRKNGTYSLVRPYAYTEGGKQKVEIQILYFSDRGHKNFVREERFTLDSRVVKGMAREMKYFGV